VGGVAGKVQSSSKNVDTEFRERRRGRRSSPSQGRRNQLRKVYGTTARREIEVPGGKKLGGQESINLIG